MAHEFESGFFRVPAWHRLGTVVEEAPTVEDAIRLAGLDWRVVERPIAQLSPELVAREIDGHKAIVRETDNRCLGVVGLTYRPLQNVEAFAFFNPFLEGGLAQLESAGSLREGQRVWVLAKLPGQGADVVPGDRVSPYLLLSNSHDGSQAVRVQFTAIRVVCMNTLSTAERRGDRGAEECLKVRHVTGLEARLEAVKRMMDLSQRTFAASVQAYQALARAPITPPQLMDYVREAFQYEGTGMPRCWERIEQSFRHGPGAHLPGVRGTYWGAYNAVTDWLGRHRGNDEGTRLDSLWFGDGKQVRDRALRVALEAVN